MSCWPRHKIPTGVISIRLKRVVIHRSRTSCGLLPSPRPLPRGEGVNTNGNLSCRFAFTLRGLLPSPRPSPTGRGSKHKRQPQLPFCFYLARSVALTPTFSYGEREQTQTATSVAVLLLPFGSFPREHHAHDNSQCQHAQYHKQTCRGGNAIAVMPEVICCVQPQLKGDEEQQQNH